MVNTKLQCNDDVKTYATRQKNVDGCDATTCLFPVHALPFDVFLFLSPTPRFLSSSH